MLQYLLVLLIGLDIVIEASQCSTYISVDGSDYSGKGTIISPFATLEKAISSADLANSRIIVCIGAGEYNLQKVKIMTNKTVVLRGYESVAPTNSHPWLIKTNGRLEIEGVSTSFQIQSRDIVVKNCDFINASFKANAQGNDSLILQNVTFYNGTMYVGSFKNVSVIDMNSTLSYINISSFIIKFIRLFCTDHIHYMSLQASYINLDESDIRYNNANTIISAEIVGNAGIISRYYLPGLRINNCKFEHNVGQVFHFYYSHSYPILSIKNSVFFNNSDAFMADRYFPPVYISYFHPPHIRQTYRNNKLDSRVTCHPGTASANHMIACPPCGRGFYSFNMGAKSQCLPCPSGTFGRKRGLQQCQQCPANTFASRTGMYKCGKCDNKISHVNAARTKCICNTGYHVKGFDCVKCYTTDYFTTSQCFLVPFQYFSLFVAALICFFLWVIFKPVFCFTGRRNMRIRYALHVLRQNNEGTDEEQDALL